MIKGMSVKVLLEDVTRPTEVMPAGPTLASTLASLRLPATMFQAYLVHGTELAPIPSWATVEALDCEGCEELLRALRNTLFDTIPPIAADPSDRLVEGVGIEQSGPREVDGLPGTAHAIVTPERAQPLVVAEVATFMRRLRVADRGCLFGDSGGGDGNAVVYGATILCKGLGIDHRVIQLEALASLLGIQTSLDALYDDFSDLFRHEALQFFGTFLILETARALAAVHENLDLASGYNRDDLMAEMRCMLVNGNEPLPYPLRPLGERRIIMPVWRIPELDLDGCHPRFSLENCRQRDARQRSLPFCLGHALNSVYPPFGRTLLEGTRTALREDCSELTDDPDLDVCVTALADEGRGSVVRDLPRPPLRRWVRMTHDEAGVLRAQAPLVMPSAWWETRLPVLDTVADSLSCLRRRGGGPVLAARRREEFDAVLWDRHRGPDAHAVVAYPPDLSALLAATLRALRLGLPAEEVHEDLGGTVSHGVAGTEHRHDRLWHTDSTPWADPNRYSVLGFLREDSEESTDLQGVAALETQLADDPAALTAFTSHADPLAEKLPTPDAVECSGAGHPDTPWVWPVLEEPIDEISPDLRRGVQTVAETLNVMPYHAPVVGPGRLLVFDNRRALHRGSQLDVTSGRELVRIKVAGRALP